MSFLPAEIIVYAAAMLPFTEINGSIPLGRILGLSPFMSLFWSILGNTTIGIILFKLLDPVTQFLIQKIKLLNHLIKNFFEKVHTKHSKRFNEIGTFLLFVFVAIPGPGTGTYTAVLVAYLFNAPFWPSLTAIVLGNIINGLFLTGGIEAVVQIIKHFQI